MSSKSSSSSVTVSSTESVMMSLERVKLVVADAPAPLIRAVCLIELSLGMRVNKFSYSTKFDVMYVEINRVAVRMIQYRMIAPVVDDLADAETPRRDEMMKSGRIAKI